MTTTHPWELAWREKRWEESSPALTEVVDFSKELKRAGAKRILDIGCGAGRHSILLGNAGFHVVGLDVSETALKTLDRRLKDAKIRNVELIKHEMQELPFIERYFDGIVSTNVLHHGRISEIRQAFNEIHRVMRKEALAYIIALSESDFRKGNGRKLEKNTYLFTKGEERGIIHHFFTLKEIQSSLRKFKTISFKERLIPIQAGGHRAHFLLKLRKP